MEGQPPGSGEVCGGRCEDCKRTQLRRISILQSSECSGYLLQREREGGREGEGRRERETRGKRVNYPHL